LLLAHSFDKEASVVIVDGKCHGSSEEKWKLIETVKTKVTIFTFGIDVDFGVPHSSFGPSHACIVYFPIFKVRDPDNMKVVNFTKL
jgi:hypothetical protein